MGEQIWHGAQLVGELIESPEAEVVLDRSGVASAVLNFSSDFDNVQGLVREVTYHPDFPWLILKDAKIKREEANLCRVRITYEGVSDDGIVKIGGNRAGSNPRYSLKGATSTAPIETHPNFKKIAGTSNDPNDGAEFDDDENFDKFKTYLDDGTKNKNAGVTQWFQPTVIYEESSALSSEQGVGDLLTELGKISEPPESPVLPKVSENKNWLMVDASAKPVGNGIDLTRRWKLSGPHGWNEDWYAEFESPE